MTPKEALKTLVDNLDQARLAELSNSDCHWTKYEEIKEAVNVLESMLASFENPPKQNQAKPAVNKTQKSYDMKTIYDEALQELKDATVDLKDLEIVHSYDVSKIEKSLVIAKKEHELLELYRYFNENTNDYDLHYDKVEEIDNKISEIEKQIKELENE